MWHLLNNNFVSFKINGTRIFRSILLITLSKFWRPNADTRKPKHASASLNYCKIYITRKSYGQTVNITTVPIHFLSWLTVQHALACKSLNSFAGDQFTVKSRPFQTQSCSLHFVLHLNRREPSLCPWSQSFGASPVLSFFLPLLSQAYSYRKDK